MKNCEDIQINKVEDDILQKIAKSLSLKKRENWHYPTTIYENEKLKIISSVEKKYIKIRHESSIVVEEQIEKILDEFPFFFYRPIFFTEHRVFPFADKDLLESKTEPKNGIVEISQGEYTITCAEDRNPILSTQGIAWQDDACRGFLLYNKITKRGGIAHNDGMVSDLDVLKKIYGKICNGKGDKLIIGYTPNISSLVKDFSQHVLKEIVTEKIDLPSDFSFDTRTGKVGHYVNGSMNINLVEEKMKERIENKIFRSFCVYEAEKN